MKNRLKQLRQQKSWTQARAAKEVGVSQPNYQRWEAGTAPIPEDKLPKLAKAFDTSPFELLGKYTPLEVGLVPGEKGDNLDYYGEVAVHFRGGGAPMILSISVGEFHRLYRQLQTDWQFVNVASLSNQTVFIRRDAIADVYFSSDAYDDFGPDHETLRVAPHVGLLLPDRRDWEIVEALARDDDLTDFDPENVQRIKDCFVLTEEGYAKLIEQGVPPEEIDRERDKKLTEAYFALAVETVYQLSTGQRRTIQYIEGVDQHGEGSIANAVWQMELDGGAGDIIVIQAEGWHRSICINPNALDYLCFPSHRLEQDRDDTRDAEIDQDDDTDYDAPMLTHSTDTKATKRRSKKKRRIDGSVR